MALARVQATPQAGGNPAVATFATPPTLGNGIIVEVTSWGTAAGLSCVDNKGNSYTLASSVNNGSPGCAIFFCQRVAFTGASFQVSVSGVGVDIAAVEVTGMGTNSLLIDKVATLTGSSAAPSTGVTAAITGADDYAAIVFGMGTSLATSVVATVTPPWDQDLEALTFARGTGEGDSRPLTGVAGTTQSGSWVTSGSAAWCATIVVFTHGVPPPAVARVSQLPVEVVVLSDAPQQIRLSQMAVEVMFAPPVVEPRLTQVSVEVLTVRSKGSPGPGITRIQEETSIGPNNQVVASIALPFAPTVGNAIIVVANQFNGGALVSCVDNFGNPYVLAKSQAQGQVAALILYCSEITATGLPFRVTLTFSSTGYYVLKMMEYSGGISSPSLTLDKAAGAGGASGTALGTGDTAALTAAEVLQVSSCVLRDQPTDITVEAVSPPWYEEVEYKLAWPYCEIDSRITPGVLGMPAHCNWTRAGTLGDYAVALAVFKAGASLITTKPAIWLGDQGGEIWID